MERHPYGNWFRDLYGQLTTRMADVVVNINTIIVSAAVIYMGVLGLKGFSPVAADNAI